MIIWILPKIQTENHPNRTLVAISVSMADRLLRLRLNCWERVTFILGVEILAIIIREESDIKEISINQAEHTTNEQWKIKNN